MQVVIIQVVIYFVVKLSLSSYLTQIQIIMIIISPKLLIIVSKGRDNPVFVALLSARDDNFTIATFSHTIERNINNSNVLTYRSRTSHVRTSFGGINTAKL